MILIKKEKDKIYFRLIFIYHLGNLRFQLINELFDSIEFTKTQVKSIKNEIKKNLDTRFK